jgi:tRNA pseudouridine55 synthase
MTGLFCVSINLGAIRYLCAFIKYTLNELDAKHKDFDFAAGELLLINKPYRWTSFDIVGKVRNAFKPLKLKVGHAGTLDPLATGLLIVCTGKMTKQIDSFQAEEKEYTGTMVLGATTPSYDMETEPDQTFDIAHLNEQYLESACKQFIGEIQQYPPAHSAIKINGERLYEKARRGEEVELRLRTITINEFELTRIELPEVDFRVVCSKGTYIRSLVHDFGKAVNSGAYLSKLRRTRSGNFKIQDAWEVMELVNVIRGLKEKNQQEAIPTGEDLGGAAL